jgi:hypothetical protein
VGILKQVEDIMATTPSFASVATADAAFTSIAECAACLLVLPNVLPQVFPNMMPLVLPKPNAVPLVLPNMLPLLLPVPLRWPNEKIVVLPNERSRLET